MSKKIYSELLIYEHLSRNALLGLFNPVMYDKAVNICSRKLADGFSDNTAAENAVSTVLK